MATIRPRGGKWEVQVRRKGHASLSKSFPKKAIAEQWAREKEQEIDAGLYRDTRAASQASLCDLCDKYLATITPTKEVTSHVPERARIGTLKRLLGHLSLAQLSVRHILDYVDKRLLKVGSDAIRRELQLLSDVVDSAQVLWGLHIVANPVPNAKRYLRKLRKLKPGNKRERRLRQGEYEKLRDATHDKFTIINYVVMFAIEVGLRRGELAAARREYVDIAKRVMHVPKSKTDWITGEKGRTVPLSPKAVEIYQSLPVAYLDGTIFGMKAESISQAFERVCEDAGIKDLRFHDLRHECVSRWFEMGFRIEEVAAMSGHNDWRSLKRYTHPDAEKLAMRM